MGTRLRAVAPHLSRYMRAGVTSSLRVSGRRPSNPSTSKGGGENPGEEGGEGRGDDEKIIIKNSKRTWERRKRVRGGKERRGKGEGMNIRTQGRKENIEEEGRG